MDDLGRYIKTKQIARLDLAISLIEEVEKHAKDDGYGAKHVRLLGQEADKIEAAMRTIEGLLDDAGGLLP